jgi:drug/metabolite transporter (DMT)-like permease
VVRSLILKPLSALFLVLAGVLFLGDPLTTGTIIGGALILLTTTLVGRQQAATP